MTQSQDPRDPKARRPAPPPARVPRSALVSAGLAVALAGALAGPRGAAADRTHDNEALNYELHVPDTWTWDETGKKGDVVEVAERRLLTLADGKTEGGGRGARLVLVVSEPPKELPADYEDALREWQVTENQLAQMGDGGAAPDPKQADLEKKADELKARIEKDLATIAGLVEVQRTLMRRFDDEPKTWPPVEIDAQGVRMSNDRGLSVPAAKITSSGVCGNLLGQPMQCQASQFVWVVRKKMYRLAMWIWISEALPTAVPPRRADAEHLRDDLDLIEMTFIIPKKEALPKRPDAADPNSKDPKPPPKNPLDKDSDQEVRKFNKAENWSLLKPLKFFTVEYDRAKDAQKNIAFRCEADGPPGVMATIDLWVYLMSDPTTQPLNPTQWIENQWKSFLAEHGQGKLETAPFPANGDFLVLPNFAKMKEVPRPPPTQTEPLAIADLERLGVASDSKGVKISGQKVRSTWRYCMRGSKERIGEDTNIQWVFATSTHIFLIRIVGYKDAFTLWKDEIAKFLREFKIVEDK